MDEAFWQERWRENRIGFHEGRANTFLERHFSRLGLRKPGTVFVPLCGKSFDLEWIADQGHQVVGIEFNEGAVEEVFRRNGMAPEVMESGGLKRYAAGPLTLFAGDFFDLVADMIGPVDAVYDRAALVALPEETRAPYAERLMQLTDRAPQLLISFDYPQAMTKGPPFSVPDDRIAALYDCAFEIERIDSQPIGGPLADRATGREEAWLLTAR